jgi:hypothetical protein
MASGNEAYKVTKFETQMIRVDVALDVLNIV